MKLILNKKGEKRRRKNMGKMKFFGDEEKEETNDFCLLSDCEADDEDAGIVGEKTILFFSYKYTRPQLVEIILKRAKRHKYLKNTNQITLDDEEIDDKIFWFNKDCSKFEDLINESEWVLDRNTIIDDNEYLIGREFFVAAFWTTSILYLFLLKKKDNVKRRFKITNDVGKFMRNMMLTFLVKNKDLLMLSSCDPDPVFKELKVRDIFGPYFALEGSFLRYRDELRKNRFLNKRIFRKYINEALKN